MRIYADLLVFLLRKPHFAGSTMSRAATSTGLLTSPAALAVPTDDDDTSAEIHVHSQTEPVVSTGGRPHIGANGVS